jgi:chemotaxis signal transduction protein
MDWAALRQRLEGAARGGAEPRAGGEAARRTLEERARALAAPLPPLPGAGAGLEAEQVVVFRLRAERHALPLDAVVEIFRPGEVVPLPGAEAPVLGVAAWRGRVLTVLDLAAGGGASGELSPESRVIVVEAPRAPVGVLADAVEEVRPLSASELHPAAPASRAREGLARGVTADALLVLDADALRRRLTREER